MNYLVMEVHPAYAVVLDEEGRFLKTANLHYQVGDTVQAGDVICTLDTESLEKQIQRKQESVADAQQTAQENYDKAVESYNEAVADTGKSGNALLQMSPICRLTRVTSPFAAKSAT